MGSPLLQCEGPAANGLSPPYDEEHIGKESSPGPGLLLPGSAGRARLMAEAGRAGGEESCSPIPQAPSALGAPLSQGSVLLWLAVSLGPFPLLQALSSLSSPDLPQETALNHFPRQGPFPVHWAQLWPPLSS